MTSPLRRLPLRRRRRRRLFLLLLDHLLHHHHPYRLRLRRRRLLLRIIIIIMLELGVASNSLLPSTLPCFYLNPNLRLPLNPYLLPLLP